MTAKQARKYVGNGLFILLLIFLLFYLLFPFYWAVVSSLKAPGELFVTPVQYLPKGIYIDTYRVVFKNDDFARGLVNSTIVSISVTALALIFGSFAAYALGRLPFRGKTTILYTILAMTMFPTIAIVGSLFTFVRNPCVVWGGDCQNLSLYNTRLALIITYLVFTLPFTTWVLTNFFKSLPGDLEQAALVDGATPFQTFYLVLLPLTLPAIVTTGMLALLAVWHNHRVFSRGIHKGMSPLHLSGMTDAPSDWLVALGYPPVAEPVTPAVAPDTVALAA